MTKRGTCNGCVDVSPYIIRNDFMGCYPDKISY